MDSREDSDILRLGRQNRDDHRRPSLFPEGSETEDALPKSEVSAIFGVRLVALGAMAGGTDRLQVPRGVRTAARLRHLVIHREILRIQ